MSEHVNGSAVSPWTPVSRGPAKAAKGDGEGKGGQKLGIDLNLTVPPEVVKAITDLAAAQAAVDAKLDQHMATTVQVMQAIQEAGRVQAEATTKAVERMAQQNSAILIALAVLDGMPELVHRALAAPRKVTLKRNSDGVATEAVSRAVKE